MATPCTVESSESSPEHQTSVSDPSAMRVKSAVSWMQQYMADTQVTVKIKEAVASADPRDHLFGGVQLSRIMPVPGGSAQHRLQSMLFEMTMDRSGRQVAAAQSLL